MKNLIFITVIFCIFSSQTYARDITDKMPNGLIANATYVKGNPDKPAILLLHGFLQSHHFSTISRLVESLSAEGFSILSPTLTLGIPNRKKSLACEALHDHTMEEDQKEIDKWVSWLKKSGHKKVILMGHSQGSTALLSYLSEKNNAKKISQFIAVSILEVNVSRSENENKNFNLKLKEKESKNPRTPINNKLSFCNNYLGTPRSFKSFQNWTTTKILKSLNKIKLPVTIIMGGSDNRIRKNWVEKLKTSNKPVIVIKGANHFMDGFHEFDLLDVVMKEIKK